MIKERIKSLQSKMIERNIGAYIIPTNDFHSSEYVTDYFKSREFMSGFTGSAGTLVVTEKDAFLFTDGRYFIQAEKELQNSDIKLMKIGEPNVLKLTDFIQSNLKNGKNIGFDSRVITYKDGLVYEKIAQEKKAQIVDADLINSIWNDRPDFSEEKIYMLEAQSTGEGVDSKIARLREIMLSFGATHHLITSLDEIAWILNCRGSDIKHFPVFLSYLVINEKSCDFFIDKKKLPNELFTLFKSMNINTHTYCEINNFIHKYRGKILLDSSKVNYSIANAITCEKIDKENPTILLKSIKNEIEIENTKNAHLRDGVYVTKMMCWLKNNVGKVPMTEMTVKNYIDNLRSKDPKFIDLSFETISAYKENAAMMHYSVTEESAKQLCDQGMILVDSGGHYTDGTTDITRTFGLGKVSDVEKDCFTRVLQGVLNLAYIKFLKGCNGRNLDILARSPLWNNLMDFRSGTGHGVGHILSVHEAPNGFRWKTVDERNDSSVFVPGMITTDEPGIYVENQFGIRIEQELLCRELFTNEYGTFYGFDTLTLCPIDLDLINPKLLTNDAIMNLNEYHELVYKKLSPFMDSNEVKWLRKYTRKI